jgi:chorismate-pyruvate lyase
MTPLAAKVNSLLYPLETFYGLGGRSALRVEAVQATELPQPYQRLLAHAADMTSTLERHVGRRLRLCVLQMQQREGKLFRHVILVDEGEQAPREYGAICIHVDALAEPARRDVLSADRPLGAILRDHGVAYSCQPTGFFQIECTPTIRDVFGIKGAAQLYGRHAELSRPDGVPIAEVVEILPLMREKRRA